MWVQAIFACTLSQRNGTDVCPSLTPVWPIDVLGAAGAPRSVNPPKNGANRRTQATASTRGLYGTSLRATSI